MMPTRLAEESPILSCGMRCDEARRVIWVRQARGVLQQIFESDQSRLRRRDNWEPLFQRHVKLDPPVLNQLRGEHCHNLLADGVPTPALVQGVRQSPLRVGQTGSPPVHDLITKADQHDALEAVGRMLPIHRQFDAGSFTASQLAALEAFCMPHDKASNINPLGIAFTHAV